MKSPSTMKLELGRPEGSRTYGLMYLSGQFRKQLLMLTSCSWRRLISLMLWCQKAMTMHQKVNKLFSFSYVQVSNLSVLVSLLVHAWVHVLRVALVSVSVCVYCFIWVLHVSAIMCVSCVGEITRYTPFFCVSGFVCSYEWMCVFCLGFFLVLVSIIAYVGVLGS